MLTSRQILSEALTHNLKTRDVKVRIIRKDGQEVKGKVDIVNR